MRCSRCNRKLKKGGYNGTQYGIVCYRLMFDPVRNPRKIKAVESDGQADLFGIIAEEKEGDYVQ
jgi:hypothetical protein